MRLILSFLRVQAKGAPSESVKTELSSAGDRATTEAPSASLPVEPVLPHTARDSVALQRGPPQKRATSAAGPSAPHARCGWIPARKAKSWTRWRTSSLISCTIVDYHKDEWESQKSTSDERNFQRIHDELEHAGQLPCQHRKLQNKNRGYRRGDSKKRLRDPSREDFVCHRIEGIPNRWPSRRPAAGRQRRQPQ
jgi:hypothetical protein